MAIEAFSPSPIKEGQTGAYTTTLKDENSVAVQLAAFTGARLTYKSLQSGATINTRIDQDILNTNNVTIHATSGLLTWKLLEADVIIVESPKPASVTYRGTFVLEWDDIAAVPRQMIREVDITIERATDAPFDP